MLTSDVFAPLTDPPLIFHPHLTLRVLYVVIPVVYPLAALFLTSLVLLLRSLHLVHRFPHLPCRHSITFKALPMLRGYHLILSSWLVLWYAALDGMVSSSLYSSLLVWCLQLLGYLFNWGLFGVLCIQVCE